MVINTIKESMKTKYNYLFLLLFSIVAIGILYLFGKGLVTAGFYLSMISITVVIMFLIWFFVPQNDWKNIFRPPIENNTPQANYNFVIGFIVPIVIYSIIRKLFMPESVIFSQKVFELYQQPAFSSYFMRTWVPGIGEEFLFGIVIVMLGMIGGYFLLKNLKLDTNNMWSKAAIILIGVSLSCGLFAFFHTLNPTYSGTDFIWAVVFRFLMNAFIWGIGAFSFAVGYHIANNSIAIGLSILGAGLLSLGGILILVLLIAIVISIIRWRENIDFTLGAMNRAKT